MYKKVPVNMMSNDIVFDILKRENDLNIDDTNFTEYFPDIVSPSMSGEDALNKLSKLKMTEEFIREIESINKNDNICIIGDYDCDGITATVIMYSTLYRLGYKVSFFIPDRLIDGYGMSMECLENEKVKNAKVLITVDNGISCKDVVNRALELGKKVIITDHHLPTEGSIPENTLIIDPKYNGDDASDICGAAVALKLTYALCKMKNIPYQTEFMLPLAGIATIADMMPMLGENRYLVKETLRAINNRKKVETNFYASNNFLTKVVSRVGGYNFLNEPNTVATESLISFYIGPTFNAVSRIMGDVNPFVDELLNALLNNGELKSKSHVNFSRKRLTGGLLDGIDVDKGVKSQVIIIDKTKTEMNVKGVLGLIANKISDSNNCVTLVGVENIVEGELYNFDFSGRSIPGYNLHEGISRIRENHPELNISGGGHAAAMGIRLENIPRSQLDTFKLLLENDVNNFFDGVERHAYTFEKEEFNNLIDNVIQGINKYSPFGQGLKSPLFAYTGEFIDFNDTRKEGQIGDYIFKVFPTKEDKTLIGKEVDIVFSITLEDPKVATFRKKDISKAEV